jgi:O-antigen/teichoic acid export membrane protein
VAPSVETDRTKLVCDSLATGVVFALLLTVGQRLIGFIRGILFCRYMTDQELGQWSMVWSFLMLLAPLAMLGLPGCFGKYSEYYRQRGQLTTFISRVGMTSVSTSLLFSMAILCFPTAFAELFFRDASQTTLTRSLALALVAVAVSNFAISLMESLRQVRMVTVMRFITGMGFAVIGTAMLLVWKNNSSAVTLAYGICCLLGLLPAIWMLWKFRAPLSAATTAATSGATTSLSHSSMWRRIAPFAVWLWVSNLLHNLFEVADRYMLLHWSETSSDIAQSMVGQYHSGRVIPVLLVSVAAMLAGVLLPYMSQAWEAGRKDLAARQLNLSFKLIGLTFTAGGVVVLLMAPFFFDVILQGRYRDGLAILPLTLVYCTWFSLFTVGQDYLWIAEKGKLATLTVAIGLVANLLLNSLLIPWLGLPGAVLATAIGNFLVVVLILVLNHWSGCRTDTGIWLISIMPLLLLCSPALAISILAAVAVVGHSTQWIFDSKEKQQGREAWQGLRKKFIR